MEYINSNSISIAITLLILMDPIGNIPIYASILKELPSKRQFIIICRELTIALVCILAFAFFGKNLLTALHVCQASVQIAGGLILFLIAILMIFPIKKLSFTGSNNQKEPFIVPLAIPLVAGPAVLAAVTVQANIETKSSVIIAVCIAWFVTGVILITSPFLKKILKNQGLSACEKLMGLVLTIISVQMFLDGISSIPQ